MLVSNAKAELAVLEGAHLASMLDRCGHNKTWDQACSDCCSVWREEQIRSLAKQAAKYGFQLVPIK